jgi:Peptidase M15
MARKPKSLENHGEIDRFEGDFSFLIEGLPPNYQANLRKSVKRRRWLQQFGIASLTLVLLGTGILAMLDRAWQRLKIFAISQLPESIIEEVMNQPVVDEAAPSEDTTYQVQRAKLANEDEYRDFIASLGLRHITPEAVIRPHRNQRKGVANEIPPQKYWEKIRPTLEAAEAIQDELGVPLRLINSAYRSPEYNAACAGSASNSYHTKNMALDLVFACSPREAAQAAKKLRSQGCFKGGIGVYASFIHIDTRGKNVDWGISV